MAKSLTRGSGRRPCWVQGEWVGPNCAADPPGRATLPLVYLAHENPGKYQQVLTP